MFKRRSCGSAVSEVDLPAVAELVVQRLQAENSGDLGVVESLTKELDGLLPQVKDIALNTKRKTQAQEEQ